jgi:hypothetical protein
MPHTDNAPPEEPGKRTGEGSNSILPHLQRQTQTQIRVPTKQPKADGDGGGPDSEPPSQ